jgi:hypothetical protein
MNTAMKLDSTFLLYTFILIEVHRKMDDEVHKHLNRQCQRTVLSELLEIEKDTTVYENQDEHRGNHVAETMSVPE